MEVVGGREGAREGRGPGRKGDCSSALRHQGHRDRRLLCLVPGWQRLLGRSLGAGSCTLCRRDVTPSRVRPGAGEMPGQKEQSAIPTGSPWGTPTQEDLTKDPAPAPRSSAPAHRLWG